MRYNGECTVWHKTNNGYITYHYPCWWQDTEAVNINKTGLTNADTALILLPDGAAAAKSDYIAHGNVDYTFENISDLLKACSPLKITTVSPKPYGSPAMRHTEVTAK